MHDLMFTANELRSCDNELQQLSEDEAEFHNQPHLSGERAYRADKAADFFRAKQVAREKLQQAREGVDLDAHAAAVRDAVAAGKVKPKPAPRVSDAEVCAAAAAHQAAVSTAERAVQVAEAAERAAVNARSVWATANDSAVDQASHDRATAALFVANRAAVEQTKAKDAAIVAGLAATAAGAASTRAKIDSLEGEVTDPLSPLLVARAIKIGDDLAELFSELRAEMIAGHAHQSILAGEYEALGLPAPAPPGSLALTEKQILERMFSLWTASRIARNLSPEVHTKRKTTPGAFVYGRACVEGWSAYIGRYNLCVSGEIHPSDITAATAALAAGASVSSKGSSR